MATLTERLEWVISANPDKAIAAFKATGASAEKELGKTSTSMAKTSTSMLKVGAGALGMSAVIVGALGKATGEFVKTAGAVSSLRNQTGLTADQSSRYVKVLGDMGIDTSTLAAGLNKMNIAVGTNAAQFTKLGINIAHTANGSLDVNKTFLNTIDVLRNMRSADDRATAGKAIFGKGWQSLAGIIAAGSDVMLEKMANVSDAELFTNEELVSAKAYKKTMAELGDSFKALSLSVGKGAAPVLGAVAKTITGLVEGFGKLDAITSGFVGHAAAIVGVGLGVAGLASVVVGASIKMATNLGKAKDAIVGVAEKLGLKSAAEVTDAAATDAAAAADEAAAAAAGTSATAHEADATASAADAAASEQLTLAYAANTTAAEAAATATGQLGLAIGETTILTDAEIAANQAATEALAARAAAEATAAAAAGEGVAASGAATVGLAASAVALGAVGAGVIVGARLIGSLNDRQEALAKHTKAAATALDGEVTALLSASDAANNLTLGADALSKTLTGDADKGTKAFGQALASLGLGSADALPQIVALQKGLASTPNSTAGAHDALLALVSASGAFVGVEEKVVAALQVGNGTWDDAKGQLGDVTDVQLALAKSMFTVFQAAKDNDLDKIVGPEILRLTSTYGKAGESALELAEKQTGLSRNGKELLPLYVALTDRLKGTTVAADGATTSTADMAAGYDEAGRSLLSLSGETANATKGLDDQSAVAKTIADDIAAYKVALTDVADAQTALRDSRLAAYLDDESQAFDAQTKALEANKSAAEADRDAKQSLIDQAHAGADAQWDLADKTDAYTDSVKGMHKAEVGAKGDKEKLGRIYRDNARAAADQADALVAAAGATADATTKEDLWRNSMVGSLGTLKGPARQAILDHIGLVEGIPATTITEIDAKIQKGDLAGAIDDLDKASTTRQAAVEVDLDKGKVTDADAKLTKLAADREVTVKAQADVATLDSQLDLATKLRTLEVAAHLDTADADAAIRKLITARNLVINAQIILKGGAGYGGKTGDPQSGATGGPMRKGEAYLVGDGPGGSVTPWSEIFVPDSDGTLLSAPQSRAAIRNGVVPQSRATGAGGGQQLSAGQLAALAATAGISFPAAAVVPTPDQGTSTADAVTEQDRLQAALYETGRVSVDSYKEYVQGRLAQSKDLSDDYLQQFRLLRQLTDDQQSAVDAQKAAADASVASQDQVQKAMFETGAISADEYQTYLKSRLLNFQQYSTDWLAVYQQLKSMTAQEVADHQQTLDDETKAIQTAYAQAQANRAAADALFQQAADESAALAAGAEGGAVMADRRSTAEQRAQAVQRLVDAEDKLADDTYKAILAQATQNNLTTGSVEWDRYVRGRLRQAIDGYGGAGLTVTAAALSGDLVGIPDLAAGGIVRATAGGTVVRLGEAGRSEAVIPLPAGHQLGGLTAATLATALAAALGSLTLVIEGTPLTAAVQRVNRGMAAAIGAGRR